MRRKLVQKFGLLARPDAALRSEFRTPGARCAAAAAASSPFVPTDAPPLMSAVIACGTAATTAVPTVSAIFAAVPPAATFAALLR